MRTIFLFLLVISEIASSQPAKNNQTSRPNIIYIMSDDHDAKAIRTMPKLLQQANYQTAIIGKWHLHSYPTGFDYWKILPGQGLYFEPRLISMAAGTPIPNWMQEIGLVPLMTDKQNTIPRHELYYHFYEYQADHTVLQHLGVRGERYKLIYFYPVNEWELYDLSTDPDEQHNLVRSAAHKKILEKMKNDLLELRNNYDDHEEAGELR